MARFRRLFYRLTPSWFHTGEGEKLLYSLGLLVDASTERLRQGLNARFPTRSSVALDKIGKDRLIRRGYREPDALYAERLVRWRDAHRRKGTALELLRQVRAYLTYFGSVKVRLVDQSGNWFTIDEAGAETHEIGAGGWNWDGKPRAGNWGRFWVIIYAPDTWTQSPVLGSPTLWGAGTIGLRVDPEADPSYEGYSIGVDGCPPIVPVELSQVIKDWKSLDSVCEWVVVAFDQASFTPGAGEPDGFWGNWSRNIGGVQTSVRLASARYWRLRNGQ
jgi:hypothetical protein